MKFFEKNKDVIRSEEKRISQGSDEHLIPTDTIKKAKRASCIRIFLIVLAIVIVLAVTAFLFFYFLFWPRIPVFRILETSLSGPGMDPLVIAQRTGVPTIGIPDLDKIVGQWLSPDGVQDPTLPIILNISVWAINENQYDLDIEIDRFLLEWLLSSSLKLREEKSRKNASNPNEIYSNLSFDNNLSSESFDNNLSSESFDNNLSSESSENNLSFESSDNNLSFESSPFSKVILYNSAVGPLLLPKNSTSVLALTLTLKPQIIPGSSGSKITAKAALVQTIFNACLIKMSQLKVSYSLTDISVRIFGIKVTLPKTIRVDGIADSKC